MSKQDIVRVEIGLTENLGNYNSLKLGATYETEQRSDESVEDLFRRAYKTVEDEIEKEREELNIESE